MVDIELKPCPFCGGNPVLEKAYCYLELSVIYCNDCDAFFSLDSVNATDEEIAEAWNRRADNG